MALFERVRDIIVNQLGVDEADVKAEASFVDDLGADSLDLVELIMSLKTSSRTKCPTWRFPTRKPNAWRPSRAPWTSCAKKASRTPSPGRLAPTGSPRLASPRSPDSAAHGVP